MFRALVVAVGAALLLATPVEAKRVMRICTPIEKLTLAEVVVLGKVTALESNTVDAESSPGAKEKVTYTVAIIKIENGLVGANNITHIKVGFIPPPPADPNVPVRPIRGGFQQVNLKQGMEGVFYLNKHPSASFYIINPLLTPIDDTNANYKDQVAAVKKGAAVLADPMKALKAEKSTDRYFASVVLLNKYRAQPANGQGAQVKVSAEESKLLLKALAEGNWQRDPNDHASLDGYMAFGLLGLTEKDGWKYPMVKPGEDFIQKSKETFGKWLDGPGKDYLVSKWTVTTKQK